MTMMSFKILHEGLGVVVGVSKSLLFDLFHLGNYIGEEGMVSLIINESQK
jgi:hypothetical protein